MRAFGWVLIICGLLWLLIGVGNVIQHIQQFAVNAPTEAARKQASVVGAWVMTFNGIVFVFPGLVVAGIGGLLAKRSASSERGSRQRSCPYCTELIKLEARVCRFCGRDLPAVVAEPTRAIADVTTCPSCGAQVYGGQGFCDMCSKPLA